MAKNSSLGGKKKKSMLVSGQVFGSNLPYLYQLGTVGHTQKAKARGGSMHASLRGIIAAKITCKIDICFVFELTVDEISTTETMKVYTLNNYKKYMIYHRTFL